jgi:hypothetical protein
MVVSHTCVINSQACSIVTQWDTNQQACQLKGT